MTPVDPGGPVEDPGGASSRPESRYAAAPGSENPYAAPPGSAPAGPPRPSRISTALLTAMFLLLALAAAAVFIPVPYVVFKPGPVTNTLGTIEGKPVIEVTDGTRTYPTSGALDFTTIRIAGGPGYKLTVYDLLEAWLSSDQAIYKESLVYPPQLTESEVEQENETMMTDSQQVATAIALRALGKKVPERVMVAGLSKSSPAEGVLKAGDTILSVDGRAITNPTALQKAVRAHRPGDALRMTIRRDGAKKTITATTGSDDGGKTIIGILIGLTYVLPVDVVVNAGDVGGPSAGMMFTLGIYDTLTPGALTGGKKIAGTGTMGTDGAVGPIDGIAQKMAGARAAGAAWFLAPDANCADVIGHVPDGLHVVKVHTFDDALGAVKDIAGGAPADLPTCTARS